MGNSEEHWWSTLSKLRRVYNSVTIASCINCTFKESIVARTASKTGTKLSDHQEASNANLQQYFPLSYFGKQLKAQLQLLRHRRWNESTSPVRCPRREANCQFCWRMKWERSDCVKESRWQIFNLANCPQQLMCALKNKCAFKKVLLKDFELQASDPKVFRDMIVPGDNQIYSGCEFLPTGVTG